MKTHLILLFTLIACSGEVHAQNKSDSTQEISDQRRNAVYFFAPGPFLGFYYLEFQHAFAQRHSGNIAMEYANFKYQGNEMVRVWLIYRYKLNKKEEPLAGFFVTPAAHVSFPLKESTRIYTSILYLSHQYVFNKGFSVQSFCGVGYGDGNVSEDYSMYTGWFPSVGVSLGYTFH